MMNDRELSAIIDDAERESVVNSGELNELNEKALKYYKKEPFGDEIEGRSQFVSGDVFDIVESDMPSLARVFLGGGEIVEFRPNTQQDVAEAEQKNIYIPWILRNIPNSFRIQHDWLKNIELNTCGVLEYGLRDERKTKTKKYKFDDDIKLAKQIQEIESEPNVTSVDIKAVAEASPAEVDDFGVVVTNAEYEAEITITEGEQVYFIETINFEDFVCSRNVSNKNDADIIGKRFKKSRGDLIAEGFDEDLVRSLPGTTTDDNSSAKQIRFSKQGGESEDTTLNHWANEEVEGLDVYVKVDFDEDGIPERRHIVKVGIEILVNEPMDHIPYAISSAILMPNDIMGMSRAETGMKTQYIQSILGRNMFDNIYSVNNPSIVFNDSVIETDDLLTQRPNRLIRADGPVAGQYAPLETPYIGDKALQIIQYVDSRQSRSTGNLLANQGLESDDFGKETATRFEGVQDASAAKIELVARVIAETGYRELYEGLAWFASHIQDSAKEIMVMGQALEVDPTTWKYDHQVEAVVGTGAGDNEKTLETLSGIYQIQQSLMQQGSPLVDSKDVYNTLEKIVKASGLNRVDRYFNDPEQPAQMLMRENELLKQQLQMMQQQMENPLSDAEKIKQQGSITRDQMKYQHEEKMKAVDINQDNLERETDTALKLTEMELQNNQNVPGSLV